MISREAGVVKDVKMCFVHQLWAHDDARSCGCIRYIFFLEEALPELKLAKGQPLSSMT